MKGSGQGISFYMSQTCSQNYHILNIENNSIMPNKNSDSLICQWDPLYYHRSFYLISSFLIFLCNKSFLLYVVKAGWHFFTLTPVLQQSVGQPIDTEDPIQKACLKYLMYVSTILLKQTVHWRVNKCSNAILGFQQHSLSIYSRTHYQIYIHQNKQLFVLIHMFWGSHTKELPF